MIGFAQLKTSQIAYVVNDNSSVNLNEQETNPMILVKLDINGGEYGDILWVEGGSVARKPDKYSLVIETGEGDLVTLRFNGMTQIEDVQEIE